MYPYIETCRIQDGSLQNLHYHQLRFERTRQEVYGLTEHPLLKNTIQVPDGFGRGIYKCRVTYGLKIDLIEYEPYEISVIKTLKLVHSETIFYSYKYADRTELKALFDLRGACDDIIIVKQGNISDSFSANIALWNGSGWITPDTPLLPGTMRASLLEQGVLAEGRITVEDLSNYQCVRLINAMRDLKSGDCIPIKEIVNMDY